MTISDGDFNQNLAGYLHGNVDAGHVLQDLFCNRSDKKVLEEKVQGIITRRLPTQAKENIPPESTKLTLAQKTRDPATLRILAQVALKRLGLESPQAGQERVLAGKTIPAPHNANVYDFLKDIADPEKGHAILQDFVKDPEQEAAVIAAAQESLHRIVAESASLLTAVHDQKQKDDLLSILSEIPEKSKSALFEGASESEKVRMLRILAHIPQSTRPQLLAQAASLFKDTSAAQKMDLLRQFTTMPEYQIPRVLTQVLQLAKDDKIAAIRSYASNFLRSQDERGYVVVLLRSELSTMPEECLRRLVSQFADEKADRLTVTFLHEEGTGTGLSKQFASEVVEEIKNKMQFAAYSNGLFRPCHRSSFDHEIYNNLGQYLMFFLNAAEEHPTSMIFDLAVFTALTKLKEEHLQDTFDIRDPKVFDDCFAIFRAMNQFHEKDTKMIDSMAESLKPLTSETSVDTIRNTFASVEYEDDFEQLGLDIDSSKISDIKEHYADLQAILRNMIAREYLQPFLSPVIEMAKGMRAAPVQSKLTWNDLQNMSPLQLSDKLQGTVTKEMILEKLEFPPEKPVPPEKQEWIREWIRDADDEKLKTFLIAFSGASALGKTNLKITGGGTLVQYLVAGEKKEHLVTDIHTCFNSATIPFQNMATKAEFVRDFEAVIASKTYNIR